jgi:RNA-directed DNA polymerase
MADIGTKPSAKKVTRIQREISDQTSRSWYRMDVEDGVSRLNRMFPGWSNSFCLGPVGATYRAVDSHARHRRRQWLQGMHGRSARAESRRPDRYRHDVLGLVRWSARTRSLPWAQA